MGFKQPHGKLRPSLVMDDSQSLILVQLYVGQSDTVITMKIRPSGNQQSMFTRDLEIMGNGFLSV